jgi:hypothetical protein
VTLRHFRIGFLLVVLAAVALGAWLSRARTTDWDAPLWVAIYPINADGSRAADEYIDELSDASFESIETFMRREAQHYSVALDEPARVELYGRIADLPPALDSQSNVLQRVLGSLRVRWWAWRASAAQQRVPPDIRIFVLYHDPDLSSAVPHSLGLQKGLLGVVHAFAAREMTGANNIVIAHEFLHTLGATDKYDPENDQPAFPEGFADPDQQPLYPQRRAEIMAGRLALNEGQWEMPSELREVVVGPRTAAEIGWVRNP